MSTKFFTNEKDNSLLKKFEGAFKHIPNIDMFDAMVGYFRASGYFSIRPFIDKVPKVRILVGINVDTLIEKYQSIGQQYLRDPKDTKDEFIKHIKNDIQEAEYDQKVEDGIFQFLKDLVNGKIEVKAHPDRKLHAKIYILRPNDFNEYTPASVITGSSNLTDAGLGTTESSNYEFNVELRDHSDVQFATDEFQRLWEQAIDILPVDLQKIKNETYLNDNFTPYELYIKLLIEYFGKRIDYDPANIDLLLPDNFKRLTYQAEAAIEGYEKLLKYNGFFLADVVGLGKTVIGAIITKKFIYENGYHTKVLIVFPPALEDNWRRTIRDFHIFNNCYFITTGSLHKILDDKTADYPNADEYDLIIIDEAHKFRNDTSQMYEKLQTITKTDRRIPGEDGDRRKKVMLLTATPLNNQPADIENQVYLFQDKRNANLPKVKDLQSFFKPLKDRYKDLKREDRLDVKKVKKIFDEIRDKVIEPLVIRRTRTDILNNKEYVKDIKEQGIVFPNINPPNPVYYEFDDELSKLFDLTVTYITSLDEKGREAPGLDYYRYRAIEFLLPEHQAKYGDVKSISGRLAAIMKTLLVKRLESSFHAFKMSLYRFQKNTQHMIDMFENDKIYIAPDVDVNKYLDEGKEDELEEKINEKAGNNQAYEASDFHDEFVDNLKKDKAIIDELVSNWDKVTFDPKIERFMIDLKKTFLKKKNNHSGKLVIFSESKETIDYIEEHLEAAGFNKSLAISADNRKDKERTIRENFDANLDRKEWKKQYNFILTTEVLAEGINLHRSNVIINYDVPWNATRLMQRIGRVNRIGTEASEINIYNFYPTDKSDNHIKLTNNALKKLQAFHTAFGEDSQIYSQLEEIGEAGLYGSQLKEEVSETLLYLQELRDFKMENPQWFNKIKLIPKKARIGRKLENVTNAHEKLPEATISYIKSENHPGVFYLTDATNVNHELNFVEAARIFKTLESEEGVKITETHHKQVSSAVDHFKRTFKAETTKKVVKGDLSPAEKRIIPKLEFYKDFAKDDFMKKIMARTIEEVKNGSHRMLPNELDKFFKQSKKEKINDPALVLSSMYDQVLKKFNFQTDIENSSTADVHEKAIRAFAKPQIVISETFTNH
ncbi:helicase-related protein [Reichenbachiella ulvae]|uniref:Helicase-related protein n=1 Tax=Reichenbachiella ulvae TaxID=2980104 RepID=A0ABT3CWJ2_9BACT|nr:helicase-related protein [Reichenbachiella ulvae]MCV9388071.1 helicase-related protein [Reichenbachiella ulvae]